MSAARILPLFGAAILASACVPKPDAPPPPQPQPTRPAAPRPVPPPPPAPADWRDIPLSAGAWVYSSNASGTQASFGPPASEAAFTVRCDRTRRQITLTRAGVPAGPAAMTIRTSFGARNLPVAAQSEPLAISTATLGANDRLLDDMAFSRGRFTVQVAGLPMLVLPAWPEPARVVEDCRF